MRPPHRVLTDDRAVSPAIGVVLLVAIAVATAVAVGALVLGFDAVNDRPQATFDFEWLDDKGGGNDFVDEPGDSPDEVYVTHTGGDELDSKRVFVVGSQPVQADSGNPSPAPRQSWFDMEEHDQKPSSSNDQDDQDGTVSQGDEIRVEPEDASPEFDGGTVRVVWVAPGGGDGILLASYTAPP
jgi:FlaG/FlaF family flagellin (archaellin)